MKALKKIKDIRTLIDETDREIFLQVDGGISQKIAPRVLEAGADVLVAGTAIFHGGAGQYGKNVLALR